jgi:MFS family permease
VDRRRTRNVMVLSDLGRALALGALPAAWLIGTLEMPVLYAAALLMGVLTVCFDVAYLASVVRLVARDRLAPANSALEGSRSAAQIGGLAVGGFMVSVLSAPATVAMSAAFFVLPVYTGHPQAGVAARIRRAARADGTADRGGCAPGPP